MSVLDQLRNARYSRVRSELDSERLERLRSAAQGLNSQLGSTGASGSPKTPDRMAEVLVTIDELQTKLSYSIVETERLAMEAEAHIDSLPPVQQTVVRLRFIRGFDWAEVAEEMGYSERQCQRHLEEAVKKLARL